MTKMMKYDEMCQSIRLMLAANWLIWNKITLCGDNNSRWGFVHFLYYILRLGQFSFYNLLFVVIFYSYYLCVSFGFQVAWLRVDTQTILTIQTHVITKNHRIGVKHSEHRTWHLQIRDVRESDRGWYMCQINTDPMKSQVGYLDVVGAFQVCRSK